MFVIAVLGLLLPGYLLARAQRSPTAWAWAAAFPLSAVLLAETIIGYTLVGVPIRFGYVLGAMALVSVVCAAAPLFYKTQTVDLTVNSPAHGASKALKVMIAVVVGLVLLGMLVRTMLFPLSGYDTAFRWEALARSMLHYQDLSYYPPVTAEDFTKYTYPDGFPPLVSTIYWWLYAAWGSPWPAITSIAVVLQAISCFALVFFAAKMLFGFTGGLIALGVLSSTTLFLHGVAIGQETGCTALSFAGQLAFALAATRKPNAGSVAVAGLFAALGAMAREYGPLLALAGFAVLACHRPTRRYLPLFCLVTAVGGGLWYVRNGALTGNPFYPLDVGLGLPSNPAYAGILAGCHEMLGLHNVPATRWVQITMKLLIGAPLALLVGIPCFFSGERNAVALAFAVAVTVFIWLWSLGYTEGGPFYSLRVLTPGFVALSIAAGAIGPLLERAGRGRTALHAAAVLAILICGGYAVLSCWSHPFSPNQIRGAIVSTRTNPLDSATNDLLLARQLEATQIPPTGVLTDNCYLALALQRSTRFRPVMIWSPEVGFLFDRQLGLAEARQRLRAGGILLIANARHSLNNFYLHQFPFFHDEQAPLRVELEIPGVETVFLLTAENQTGQDNVGKLQP